MFSPDRRQTKIVCSLGHEALAADALDQETLERVDAVRVLDDDDSSEISPLLERIREVRTSRRLPIMFDLGAKIRGHVEGLDQVQELTYGSKLVLSSKQGEGDLWIETDEWEELFRPDASVFLGFGSVSLRVQSVAEGKAEASVVQGGSVYPRMTVHVPETRPHPTVEGILSERLDRVLGSGIDYVVIPGMTDIEGLKRIHDHMQQREGHSPWLIIKIDSLQVFHSLRKILDHVEGILISRLELALTSEPANVPMISKEAIQACNAKGKLVVTASETLASMRYNPTPTRAEISDIANAVIDGADGVVLSEEITQGPSLKRAVKVMCSTISSIERDDSALTTPNWIKLGPSISSPFDAVAYGAYRTARRIKAKAIVCITHDGNTAMRLASFRDPTPIIAVTFSKEVLSRLEILRGVEGFCLAMEPNIDEILPRVNELLIRDSWLESGDRIIFVSITLSSVGRQASNLFTVQQLN